MNEPVVFSGVVWVGILTILSGISTIIEPQLAGILGAFAYLIVRHELNLASLTIKNILVVAFFGWLGAWAALHVLAHYTELPLFMIQIASATIGFMSYDAMLTLGKNTDSVIGFVVNASKKIINKKVD